MVPFYDDVYVDGRLDAKILGMLNGSFRSSLSVNPATPLTQDRTLYVVDENGTLATREWADGRFVNLTTPYDNPVFVNTLAWSKITGAPEFLTESEAIATYIPLTQRGAVNGVATLDGTGKIPSSQIPAVAITDTFIVDSEAEMLALTAQVGDVAFRTDLTSTFILREEPASTLASWTRLTFPSAETDPIFTASPAFGITSTMITNWNTAFGWGNHAGLYVPLARTVSAGTGLTGGGALSANITLSANFGTAAGTIAQGNDSRINNGQTAFGWGNHASAGYATASNAMTFTNKAGNISQWTNDAGYITSGGITTPTLQQVTAEGRTTTLGINATGSAASDWMGQFVNSNATSGHGVYAKVTSGIAFRADIGANIYAQINTAGRWLFGANTADDGSAAMQVTGIIRASNQIASTDGTVRNILSYIAGTGGVIGTQTNHSLLFWANGAEKVRLLANGRLGIATSAPDEMFHVIGAGIIGESSTNAGSTLLGRVRMAPEFNGLRMTAQQWNGSTWVNGNMYVSGAQITYEGNVTAQQGFTATNLKCTQFSTELNNTLNTVGFSVGSQTIYRIDNAATPVSVTLPTASAWTNRILMFIVGSGTGASGQTVTIGGMDVNLGPDIKGPLAIVVSNGTTWLPMQGFQ